MGADLLQRCAEALYGAGWRTPLADDLQVALRTVQRWAAGEREIADWAWAELDNRLAARAAEIADLRRALAAHDKDRTPASKPPAPQPK